MTDYFFRCSCIIFSEHDLVSDADYTDHIQHREMLHLGTLLSWKGCHKSNIVISIHKTLSVGVHIGLSADQCYKISGTYNTQELTCGIGVAGNP